MFRIAIVVAILFAARAKTLENDEKEEIALKRLLEFGGASSIKKLEDSDPNIEKLPIFSGGEKEDTDYGSDGGGDDITSSSAVTKEDDDEVDLTSSSAVTKEDDDEVDLTSSSAVTKEDDGEEDVTSSSAVTKEDDDEEDLTSSSAVTKEDDDEVDLTSSSAVTKEDHDEVDLTSSSAVTKEDDDGEELTSSSAVTMEDDDEEDDDEESDRFEPNIEELPIFSGGEKEDMGSESDSDDINSSSSLSKEDGGSADDEQNLDSGSFEDDSGKDWYASAGSGSKIEKSESDEDDPANEHTFERSLEASLSVLKDMINKANPDLKESTKRSFEDEDMIEGDIKLDKESAAELVEFYKRNPQYLSFDDNVTDTSSTDALSKRKVRRTRKWRAMPIKYRIVGSTNRIVVKQAISIWQQETCLRFLESWSFSAPGITFMDRNEGCWSYVGKVSSKPGNIINLQKPCQTVGITLHEIGHAIGFYHEQSRPDRNRYVKIQKENIRDGKAKNFVIKPSTTYGTQYDYGSIMHYKNTAFTKEHGLKTIIAKQPHYERTMGQRTALSFYDIKAANYHHCQGKCTGGLYWSECRNGGYKNPNNCERCKCPDGWTGRYCQFPSFSKPTWRSCGSRYRTAKKKYRSLQSPGYSSSGYTSTTECTWKIRAPVGKRVKIYFRGVFKLKCNKKSETQVHVLCGDFVEVRYKSLTGTGPRFCCDERPRRSLTSTGREMLILFRTFSGKSDKGFHVRYRYV